VKYYETAEMLSRIREVIDPSEIDYIVSNHTETDHSGALGELVEIAERSKDNCESCRKGKFRHAAS